MEVQPGYARPLDPFDDQHNIVIYHENNYIANIDIDLAPFHSAAAVVSTVDQIRGHLSHQNGPAHVVVILPRQAEPTARNFVQHEVLTHPSVEAIVPFFLDGGATNPQVMNVNAVNQCHPINSNVMARTRMACAAAINDNIAYCLRMRSYYEERYAMNSAIHFMTRANEGTRLNRAFLDRWITELDLGMAI